MALAAALLAYATAINILAFALFGIDKRRAVDGAWRIRESTLIWAALLGGWPGAKAGQRRFRHKTRKQPFARRLDRAGLVQLCALAAVAVAAFSSPVGVMAATGWFAQRIGDVAATGWSAYQTADVASHLDPGAARAADPSPKPPPRRFGPGTDDWSRSHR